MAAVLVLAALALSGCVSTTLQTDWRDPAFRGSFRKVIVVCLVKEMVVRNTLEDDLAAQFKTRGIEAVQSYTLFPSLENIDKETVRAKVKEIHADGVFLVRIISRESIEVVTSQFKSANGLNYYDHWGSLSEQSVQGGQGGQIDRFKVETSLFEAAQGKIVWQALSETYDDNPWTKTVRAFAVIMTQKLIQQGLI
jgi:hypothetical protein